MTVSYQYDVASSSTGGFFKLLWRWRGSIWKLLYKELLLFIAVYLSIAFSYDFLMTDYYKRYYERIVIFCSAFVEIIPLSFILGFYVSFTATRWWQQYTAIPWPDKLMNIIALYVPGNDVTSRVLRRTLMRYLNLTLVLVLRSISIPVKRRFPTKEHLVEAGFMSRPELEMYSSVPSHEFNTFWIPCTWFVNLLREAKSECRITDSGGIKLIMEEFNEFRSKCGLLWSYDWVSIPLVYTQVVTLSTQAFFLASLLGRQHINPPKGESDIKSHVYGEYYIPVFTLLQFILYMGMLKLGEQLINPFGDDDEDFELNWIIDRHLKVSFLGVDILNSDPPPLIKDNYFDEMDIKLPYTEAAVAHKVKTYRGSVAAFHVPTEKHGLVIPEFDDENGENTDDEAASTIQSNKEANVRNSSWNLFGRKRKLSSSIDSFNSETMVETGLGESPSPVLQANPAVWPPTTNQVTKPGSSQACVWLEKAPEDTQGIRGADLGGQPKDKWTVESNCGTPNQPALHVGESELVKQCSFSTSDSSIAIPLEGEPDQRSSANYSKYSGFRRSPLQVFSKEFANASINIFKPSSEPGSKVPTDRSSLSSISTKSEKSSKPHKSLMKCHRSVDPKLRIKPFRSKVTFSEDTKAGDYSEGTKLSVFAKWDSSSDSVSSMLRSGEEKDKRHRIARHSASNLNALRQSAAKTSELPFTELCKRRQSLDPALYLANQKEELTKDNWLHYQSLPNIQEEDQLQASPTETSPPPESMPLMDLPETSSFINIQSPPIAQTTVHAGSKVQTHLPLSVPQTTMSSSQNVLLPPQPAYEQGNWNGGNRRRSIKRQKSQDLHDEDINLQKVPPVLPKINSKDYIKKQSSDESQTSNLTDVSSTSNQVKGTNVCMVPPGILRRRNEDLKPQASTESDTGSYHTVNSFLMHVEKSASSSIDSFTSAVSESLASNNGQTQVSNGHEYVSTFIPQSEFHGQPSEDEHYRPPHYQTPFPAIESSLVPKIVFSQSTPSVTSQSSDDQSSPKWDEKCHGFSNIEIISSEPNRNQRRLSSIQSSSRQPNRQTFSPIATPQETSPSVYACSNPHNVSERNEPVRSACKRPAAEEKPTSG